jgi:hypothetical protein
MGLDARVPENSRRFSEVDLGGRIDEYDGAAVESELHHRRPGHVSDARLYSWSRATSLDIAKSGRRQCPTMDTRCQRARYLASAIDRPPSRSLRASAETHSGRVPHQTTISRSRPSAASRRSRGGSATRSGTMPEASQNLTAHPGVRRAEPGPRSRLAGAPAPQRVERQWTPRTSQKPCPLEAREPVIGMRRGLHALETRDGLIPIKDEHGLPGPDLLDVGAQAVLAKDRRLPPALGPDRARRREDCTRATLSGGRPGQRRARDRWPGRGSCGPARRP